MKRNIKDFFYSSSLLIASQFFSLLLTLGKNKIFALYLGPTGLGLLSAFNSTLEILVQFFGFGTTSAIVRDTALNSDDESRLRNSINTIRSITLIQAVIASLFTFIFSKWLSFLTFESYSYSTEIKLLSIAIFFSLIHKRNVSILEGLIIIKTYAYQTLVSTFVVVAVTSVLVFMIGTKAVLPIILFSVFFNFLISQHFQKSALLKRSISGFTLSVKNSHSILTLGLTVFIGGIISAGTEYFSRIYIIQSLGLDSLGFLQAAQSLAFIFINFILAVIAKYYFPKIISYLEKKNELKALMDLQIEVGVLVTFPFSIILAFLAPVIVPLLYTSEFGRSVPVLHLLLIVGFLKIFSWPLSYFFVAKNDWKRYLVAEFSSNLTFATTLILTIPVFGIAGFGVAAILQYTVYSIVLIYFIIKKHEMHINRRVLMLVGNYIVILSVIISLISWYYSAFIYYLGGIFSIFLIIDSLNRLSLIIFASNLYTLVKKILT